MTDRRFHPANPRVAHISLDGQVDPGLRLTSGETRRFTHPVTDLCRAPDGARDKQMLFGQGFQLLEDRDGWAFGFDPVDTYVGYVPSDTLGPAVAPTHRISQRSTHVYTAADIKSADRRPLSFLSEISVTSETKDFVELADGGFVPKHHVQPLSWRTDDAASMAEMFLGTPYLWGGNSAWGIDCSGLVQLALYASGRACPRDSDTQAKAWPAPTTPLQRGDLVFWKGHVGMMVDQTNLIHANAHHMAVAIEPLDQACARIAKNEFGEVIGTARP